MTEPHEIKLDDNSRLHLALTKSGALSVQLLKPGTLSDGHGLLLAGSAIVEGDELRALLATLTPSQKAL